jgi:hypothetical protein
MSNPINRPEMSFCDTCVYRGMQPTGEFCARAALDNMIAIMESFPASEVIPVPDGQAGCATVGEVAAEFDARISTDVLACIDQIEAGGQPLTVFKLATEA